ncbi:MAG: D-glycero-beta-D-manno-heptose-7-phosphate kinase [Bacteroidetes bacterium]|nr:D-glycero-beta-D-manno-heptose-7-phosphate kinase [Bacteroidota bacterium]
MIQLSKNRVTSFFNALQGKRIAVLGDVMIDKYIWGAVSRISPEAPVPVVDVDHQNARLGGAANVANNIQSLGCEPILIGVVGNDAEGAELKSILEAQHCSSEGIILDDERITTVKTRVIAHQQHVVRIDREQRNDINEQVQKKILSFLESRINELDAIIIEDYNKGLIVKNLIHQVTALAKNYQKIITVDPKYHHFFEYKGVTVFKPNRKETEEGVGKKFTSEEELLAAGKILLQKLEAENILLTRSEKGMTLFEKNGAVTHFPTKARKVADVSGAGDTVIGTLTAMLACGASIQEAAIIANHAGGIVVGEVGIVPIDAELLKNDVLENIA